MEVNQFNIRVYGFLLHDDSVLITDEYRLGTYMTKFPGGGLHYGEGTIDCLKREFMEELDLPVEVVSHFYTTDFFQPTSLIPTPMQLISIYYIVKTDWPLRIRISTMKNDLPPIEGAQSFRWLKLAGLNEEMFTFPVDKHVTGKLLKWHQSETTQK